MRTSPCRDFGFDFFDRYAPVPATVTNLFAALSAPYDETLSILVLHRPTLANDPSVDLLKNGILSSDKRFKLICRLTDDAGKIISESAAEIGKIYRKELTTPSANTNYLEWETRVNASGWQSDAPKGL